MIGSKYLFLSFYRAVKTPFNFAGTIVLNALREDEILGWADLTYETAGD
jgi:hypothetical protein